MAAFRSITGVEEAASAIFHALRRRAYENAKILKFERHFHKSALHPFIGAIAKMFASLDIKTQLHYDKREENPTLKVAISFPNVKELQGQIFYPTPPLHYYVFHNGKLCDFSAQIEQLVNEKNVKSMIQHSRDIANMRNRLLYASSEGCPYAKSPIDPYIESREKIVMMYLKIYLLIDPHKEKQLFVQQALNAFINALNLADVSIGTAKSNESTA